MSRFVCTVCGSTDLELTLVVDPNTMNVVRWNDIGGKPDVWCNECGSNDAQITTQLVFDKKKLIQKKAEFADEADQRMRGDL